MTRSPMWWLLLLAAALAVAPVRAAEATGSLAGTVRDANTLAPITEAIVQLVGTPDYGDIYAWTAADGSYLIESIRPGTWDFDGRGWDRESQRVYGVQIVAGETTTVDFALSYQNPRPLMHAIDSPYSWPDGDCRNPAVTPDGRFVVFDSEATNLVAGDTNGQSDVFLLDRATGQLTLISRAADGSPANGASYGPSISADGRYVGYYSNATNLAVGGETSFYKGYIYDRETGTLTVATVGDDGALPDSYASGSLSDNGRYYYFLSTATNLDPADASDSAKLLMRDLVSQRTWRVDAGFDGSPPDDLVACRGATPEGRYLLLDSGATNLVPDDTNGRRDLFVYDSGSGTIELADVASDGSPVEFPTSSGMGEALSGDGRYVAFSARDQDLWPDLVFGANAFVRDRATGSVELAGILDPSDPWYAVSAVSCYPMAMSADGRLVAFFALHSAYSGFDGPAYVRDRTAARTVKCASIARRGGGNWRFSANGQFLVASTWENSGEPLLIWLWEPELLSFGTLEGTVRDDAGEPVPHADLWIGSALYMRADGEGTFSIDVPVTESTTLRASADGYASALVEGLAIGEGETVPVEVILGRQFSDVEAGSWADDSVAACLEAGIVGGYADGSYHPSESVTRGQMAVYIARALAGGDGGVVPPPRGTQSFGDVPADHWAFRYIESCLAEGAVQGYPDGSYQPDQSVNRGQMAVYIARAMVSPTGDAAVPDPPAGDPTFSDVSAENEWGWCYRHVEYCAAEGVVQGYWDGSYRPEAVVTRDQMAVYIQRAFELQ
jgi:Tol biopolymer transport system component